MASYGSNLVQGAGAGAAVGSSFGGVGAGVGGIIGGLAGLFGAAEDAKSKKAYNQKLEQAAAQYGIDMDELAGMVEDYYNSKGSLLDDTDKEQYRKLLTDTDWGSIGSVDFDKDAYDVNDYYDQNASQQIAKAQNDALGSANISGSLLGSGAVGQQIQAAVDTESDLADKAYDRMNSDRDFDYQLASDEASRNLEAVKNQLSALGTAYASDEQDDEDYMQTLLGLKQAKSNATMQAYMAQQV